MFTPPLDLDDLDVLQALRAGWNFEAVSVRYAPLGFGSHHWIGRDPAGSLRFVTVDCLAKRRAGANAETVYERLTGAFETARTLGDHGLEFVVAPLPDRYDKVLGRVGERYSIAVFPFVTGRTASYDEYPSERERRPVEALLARLHQVSDLVSDVARREDFVLPCRIELAEALTDLDQAWDGGPMAEPTRGLLRLIEPRLRGALGLYDELAAEVASGSTPWVITRGEPHPANVLWTEAGPRLIDWDTAMLAPAGRDLWMVRPPRLSVLWTEGADLVLYRLWWDLDEIAGYVAEFRQPHQTTDDTRESWRNLQHFARLEHWEAAIRTRR